MLREILIHIRETQAKQDAEGKEHPGETAVFTFFAPFFVRILLKLRFVKGLTFERYQGDWYGVFRALK